MKNDATARAKFMSKYLHINLVISALISYYFHVYKSLQSELKFFWSAVYTF